MKTVIINGATGRMGQTTVQAIEKSDNYTCVAALSQCDDLADSIKTHSPDIVIDFTVASVAFENLKTIIEHNVHPVIGTSGLLPEQVESLQAICREKKLGGIIAPNFSIGAVLMMKYAQDAAKYFDYAEIIELHHEAKEDSPSGTAIKTADMIARSNANLSHHQGKELLAGARGAKQNNVAIHAVRMPGLVAHQQVLFGGHGETLTLKHDSINRECFMPGVIMSCDKVTELNELVYGLENLL